MVPASTKSGHVVNAAPPPRKPIDHIESDQSTPLPFLWLLLLHPSRSRASV